MRGLPCIYLRASRLHSSCDELPLVSCPRRRLGEAGRLISLIGHFSLPGQRSNRDWKLPARSPHTPSSLPGRPTHTSYLPHISRLDRAIIERTQTGILTSGCKVAVTSSSFTSSCTW